MSLTHLGRPMHKQPDYVTILCDPFSYLYRRDYVPVFDEPITCFYCLVATVHRSGAEHGWRRV